MNKIIFPLKLRMKRPEVADLQDALQLLLDRSVVLANDERVRRELSAALKPERDRQTYDRTTHELVSIFQTERRLQPSGEVDEPTANALNRLLQEWGLLDREPTPKTFRIAGVLRFADGAPASQTKVSAFDRDLRNEQPLGEGQTDRSGAYRIEYSERQFLNRERGTADLVVKALDADDSILVASPVLFNAPPDAEIDLTIPLERRLPPTLFERIASTIEPLLGLVKVEELEEDQEHQDLTFLSGETGFEKSVLARFVLAHSLALLGIEREFWFALLGGSFFEYAEKRSLKENLTAVSDALPALDARAVRKALTSSFNRREIPAGLSEQTDGWIEAFLELVARLVLRDDKSPTFVKMALDHAGIGSADKQAKFARLFNQHKALTPELLAALEKDQAFKKAEIDDLRTSYQLAELTRGDFSVVKMLKDEFTVRRPEQIRTLAKRSERQWVELIERKHKAGDIKLPLSLSVPTGTVRLPEAEIYAKALERQFREAFPTAAFAGGLERALGTGGARGFHHAASLGQIIERYPEFDLLRTPVDEFLTKGVGTEFRGLAKDETFRLELKAVQRAFKLAPTFDATDALLADGLHSAQMVYRLGESQFVRRYANRPGFSADSARLAWNRAADTHAAVLTVIGDLAEFDSGILPGVLQSSHPDLAKFPNWENLFKAGDICHCEHCRSVMSPAAYFTDLLMFLGGRDSTKPKNGGKYTVKDLLFDRRPDLGYLELNCENALTTLPYVDIVCEVLEKAVDASGENDLVLTDFTPVTKTAVANALAVAFKDSANDGKEKIALGDEFTLSQVDPADPNRWVVHGDDATYLLKKKGAAPNFFAELLPNTKASSEDLRAYPAYVNPKAYTKLRQARFPLALPFDLFAEEVRAAFRKSNLQRWDLMRTFRGPTAPNNPTDGDIAAEYFGISVDTDPTAPIDEKRLILLADTTVAGQQAVWGEPGNAKWLSTSEEDKANSLANVKTFLRKSGLEYEELLALVDLSFINPLADIYIEHLDSSCDTDQKVIRALSAAKLDRIHRFLRLWRKLSGWKMWELDLVLRCKGIGHSNDLNEWLLDETFLINLYYLGRLRSRLGAKTPVAQLCGLFDNLDTETHFTKLHEKRADGLYQSLFLNRRLIKPLDPAFKVAAADVGEPTVEKISGYRSTILAVLGVSEADLDVLASLTRASNGAAYITDDLTLKNLSFLWRHAWLGKLLKFKTDEWKTVLKLLQQDIVRQVSPGTWVPSFADPKVALEFVEKVDHLRAAGFTPDELNWLLAADRSAKAAAKEADAARFLTTLRTELQAMRRESDPARYEFLEPPADVESLTALLTSLLQRLNRDEGETKFFVDTLRDEITQEKAIPGLPAGFNVPAAISGAPHNIRIQYEPVLQFRGVMTAAQLTVMLTAPSLAAVTGLPSYQQAVQKLFEKPGSPAACDLPPGFSFPAAITGAPHNIPILYKPVLRFSGLMTDAQKAILLNDPSLAAVTGIAPYQQAIEEFFQAPRLALKFLDPVFTEPLPHLPAAVDFKALPDLALALKVSYDVEEHALRVVGILSVDEKTALDALSADPDYRNALKSLFTQPTAGVFPAEKLWLQDVDLQFPLRDLSNPANDKLKDNLTTAVKKGLTYLSKTLSEDLVVRQAAAQLGLSEGLTRRLLTQYAFPALHFSGSMTAPQRTILLTDPSLAAVTGLVSYQVAIQQLFQGPGQAWVAGLPAGFIFPAAITGTPNQIPIRSEPIALLAHFMSAFATTAGVVDYATLKTTFDGWFWANRIAALWKKWKLTSAEWERVRDLTGGAQLLDFVSLPLDAASAMAPIERFLRTGRLLRVRESLPEADITLLEVLVKLSSGGYAAQADFAHDVQRLNETWTAANVEALIGALDLAYPNDYLLAESWERVRRAFYFVESLNAGATTVKTLAAATMADAHAKTLKALLRSKFGSDTWLTLSAEIQDALRERKRDALAAYLLSQSTPADAPTGKWENTNDLYAYYLLDVEMSACQLSSRLVQASGSVQLFVQRCLMGLEPDVKVQADGDDGDSAWRWWKWMRKYRVWEANRKVFLWPENWIEPELKKDRSPFFKDLENELLQNEINQYTVETAFANYLEKLDGVAQLEIAGFYQEDDGDDTIVHVFGRTAEAEPHIYYYRRYDYRQWTPWEKVDLDIQGDYLVPAVVNKRLFLFWPVFTEVPDQDENSKVDMPDTVSGSTLKAADPPGGDQKIEGPPPKKLDVKKASKRLRLQMAVSDYRQGKWTSKRISEQYAESETYELEIVRKHYAFFPIDRSGIDGRFGINYGGYSADRYGNTLAHLADGAFEIAGCKGVPELGSLLGSFRHAIRPQIESTGDYTSFLKWEEAKFGYRGDYPQEDFTLDDWFGAETPVLNQTPDIFKVTPPWHLSYLDRFWVDIPDWLIYFITHQETPPPAGTWLPFFYSDKKRSFFVLPSLGSGSTRTYYPDIKSLMRKWEKDFEGEIEKWVDTIDLPPLNTPQRYNLDQFLHSQVPGETVPPFTDAEVRERAVRFFMRLVYYYYLGPISLSLFPFRRFHFLNFYHPFVCDFAKLIHNPREGVPGLMKRHMQLKKNNGFSFLRSYGPTDAVDPLTDGTLPEWAATPGYPKEVVDFSPDGAYSSYNWELFFHAPLLIANALSRNQRFEESRDWYHFIFNPIGVESPMSDGPEMSKYWITKPFFQTTDPQYVQQRIENILQMLAKEKSGPNQPLTEQVRDWRINPFEPHRIAKYRTVAYQKTVVMKYLDNLIAWGDYLFRQDSMESINEATQLYILAAELLGPRPKRIPPAVKPPVESFNELEKQLDAFANALVEVENLIPAPSGTEVYGPESAPLPMLYFCIPHNDKMLGYWDTVADRLYKIRHCMNIEGVLRQLALFEPPIDPGALVKAVAGGIDIGAALADLNAPLPFYRFNVLLQKANEVCNDVKALGAALLSALEKKDGEALSLLRQGQEMRVLEAVKAVREKQIEEATENLAGLKKSKELAEIKKKYYESRDFMNPGEAVAIILSAASTLIETGVALGYVLAGGLKSVPQFLIGASGFGGSPHATGEQGGKTFGEIAEDAALTLTSISRALEKGAAIATTLASYKRREEEWDFQKDLAVKEIEQLDRSIAAADLRFAIAEKELENHVSQIENAKAIDAFMRSKYTNEELYQWQIGQISGVYFQSYKLAYDLAKRAERCFRFELGLQDSSFISFGYWDSLKKGLLSGEKLQYDLRRLESAYLEQNRREFELTKHVSLALLDPLALVRLREAGRCFFRLPEELFDLDYPGHYFRRIKTVGLTLPCVAGPYTTISCTLRLLKNSIRINTTNGDNGYPRNTDDAGRPADDPRFVENNIPVKAIAASSGQNDSGVFELSFRDERYLPFEGAGAISEWSLELFSDLPANNPDPTNPDFGQPLRQFDYSSITDAVLHVRYAAREDAGTFKNGAIVHLREYFSRDGATPSLLMLNLRRDFPTQWSRFLNPTNPANGNVFDLEMSSALFPMRDAGKTLKINAIYLLARCTNAGNYGVTLTPPLPVPPPPEAYNMVLTKSSTHGGLHFDQKDVTAAGLKIVPTVPPVTWRIKVMRPDPEGGNLIEDPVTKVMEVGDVILVLGYEWQ
jgi:hypothetical protein